MSRTVLKLDRGYDPALIADTCQKYEIGVTIARLARDLAEALPHSTDYRRRVVTRWIQRYLGMTPKQIKQKAGEQHFGRPFLES